MRNAFSMESPWGADLAAIAETIASCRLGKKMKKCRDEDCKSCGTRLELKSCVSQLSDCDLLRVKQMVRDLYAVKEFQHGADRMTFNEGIKEAGRCVLSLVMCILALFGSLLFGWCFLSVVLKITGGF